MDQPRDWKCYKRICGEVSSFEAKDSSEGNYRGQGKGFTTGSLYEETRFPQVDLLAGLENDFNFGATATKALQHFDRLSGWKEMFQCWARANTSLSAEEL